VNLVNFVREPGSLSFGHKSLHCSQKHRALWIQPSHGTERREVTADCPKAFGKPPLEEVTEGLLSTDQNSQLLYPCNF